MVNSKDTSNSTRLVEFDVSLIDVNAVATTLQEYLGEAVNIVFTATYSETIPDEYDVMALFLYKGESRDVSKMERLFFIKMCKNYF